MTNRLYVLAVLTSIAATPAAGQNQPASPPAAPAHAPAAAKTPDAVVPDLPPSDGLDALLERANKAGPDKPAPAIRRAPAAATAAPDDNSFFVDEEDGTAAKASPRRAQAPTRFVAPAGEPEGF